MDQAIEDQEVVETEEVAEVKEVEGEETEETTEEKEVELWQQEESEEQEEGTVPVGSHIKMKDKLKGRISQRDEEIDKLRREVEDLKTNRSKPTEQPKMPNEEDFEENSDYRKSLETYYQDLARFNFEQVEVEKKKKESYSKAKENLDREVDNHYERVAQLVESSGMSSEIFKKADTAVREAVDAIIPKQGDIVVDHYISILGEGSEKVLTFIGRNPKELAVFQSMIASDSTGMKAMAYLGQQKERLTNPQKRRTSAPAPAADAKGDESVSQQGSALKRKYDKAHKSGSMQQAFDIKRQARKDGVDTSSW